MSTPHDDRRPAAEPHPAVPAVDLGAVLAAMQDQIDDLTATIEAQQQTIEAQQQTIDDLVRAQRATEPSRVPPPAARPGGGQR